MDVTCMEVDTDREKQLDRPLKRRCLRDPIETHTSLQTGSLERVPQRTDRVDSFEDDGYLNFLKSCHNNCGSVPVEAYRCGSSSSSNDLADPQYKVFFESLRVTRKSYELEVQVDVGTSILLKYDIEDQPHVGLNLEDLKSRTLKNTAEMVRSLRNAVRREKDEVAAWGRKENDKERRIPRDVSGKEKESLQTTKAAATSKGYCNMDKRNIEAQPANLGSTRATRLSPRVLRPEVQQTPEPEEETWDESYVALLQCLKEDGSIIEFASDIVKQIRYEEDDEESPCEVELLTGEDISKCEEYVTTKLSKDPITIDSKHFADDPGSSSSTVFRKKLMGILKMPYDEKEHEDLSRRVRHKRQKKVEKSLRRGRDFTSSLGQRCKSYLELYKDFSKELKLVRGDCHRNLNLLRGFFFWLENIPREGAFKPWLDPTCLKVLPAQAIKRV